MEIKRRSAKLSRSLNALFKGRIEIVRDRTYTPCNSIDLKKYRLKVLRGKDQSSAKIAFRPLHREFSLLLTPLKKVKKKREKKKK